MEKLMAPEKAFALLKKYGIPYADWKIAKNNAYAVKAAAKLGFPVAMKIVSKKLVHKSDAGGVKTNVDEEGASGAFEELMQAAKKIKIKPEGILIQKMEKGIEVIVGMKKDAQFGPVVVFGLGGVFVEVMKDVTMRIAPLTESDCVEMIEELKSAEILKGARGREPVNIKALTRILMAVSEIGMKYSNIAEMDLNPVMVNEKSASVVDARIMTLK
jgi:acetyl-CoA synthetase (ADP-forming)